MPEIKTENQIPINPEGNEHRRFIKRAGECLANLKDNQAYQELCAIELDLLHDSKTYASMLSPDDPNYPIKAAHRNGKVEGLRDYLKRREYWSQEYKRLFNLEMQTEKEEDNARRQPERTPYGALRE